MNRSLCLLIMGTTQSSSVLIETAKLCSTIRNEHPHVGDGQSRDARILLLHPAITTDANDKVAASTEWAELLKFCAKNLIGIKAIPEGQLLSISPAQTIGFVIPHIAEDVILLMAGDAFKSSISKAPAFDIWQCVEAFYRQQSLWIVVAKNRDFAFIRTAALRSLVAFASSSCAARRSGLLSVLWSLLRVQRPRLWSLNESAGAFSLDRFNAIYQELVAETHPRPHFVRAPSGLYAIQVKATEEYTCTDMVGMMELEASLGGGVTKTLPR